MKYETKYNAKNKATFELKQIAPCFNKCVSDVMDAQLSADEKNCI